MMRARLSAAEPDQGLTLVELLMFILLFGMVSGIVTTVATTGLHHQRQLQDRSDALAQARTAVQRIDRDIRSTSQVDRATSSVLLMQEPQFSGASVTGSRWACYYVDSANELVAVSETTAVDCSVSSTGARKVLVTNLTNSSDSPLFSYAPVTGYTAPSGSGVTSSSCAMSGTTPTAYDPSCIGTITVQVLTQPTSLKGPVSVNDNGTELRNVQ